MKEVNIYGMIVDALFTIAAMALFTTINFTAFGGVIEHFAYTANSRNPAIFAFNVCFIIGFLQVAGCHSIWMYHYERNRKDNRRV